MSLLIAGLHKTHESYMINWKQCLWDMWNSLTTSLNIDITLTSIIKSHTSQIWELHQNVLTYFIFWCNRIWFKINYQFAQKIDSDLKWETRMIYIYIYICPRMLLICTSWIPIIPCFKPRTFLLLRHFAVCTSLILYSTPGRYHVLCKMIYFTLYPYFWIKTFHFTKVVFLFSLLLCPAL